MTLTPLGIDPTLCFIGGAWVPSSGQGRVALDVGKPLKQARADVIALARYMEFYAGACDKLHGETIPYLDGYTVYTLREPHGVTGHIIPWNYPMQIIGRSVGAALATGNAAVLKPAEEACLTALAFAEIARRAGLPDGALNVVPGLGAEAGAALTRHKGVHHVSFTGSVGVGKLIQETTARNVVPVTLELGGKSPQLVFDDADIDAALPFLVNAGIQNAGQTCSAASRILVQRGVYDRFVAALKAEVVSITPGAGIDPATRMGPLVSKRRVEAVTEIISEAVSAGAKLVTGGERVDHPGFFYRPTLLENVPQSARIMNEEPFGPVALLAAFDTVDEAVTEANRLAYGLAAYAFTTSIRTSQILQNKIETGMLAINHTALGLPELPLGGIKDSGFGSEGGPEAIESYVYTKLVTQKS